MVQGGEIEIKRERAGRGEGALKKTDAVERQEKEIEQETEKKKKNCQRLSPSKRKRKRKVNHQKLSG